MTDADHIALQEQKQKLRKTMLARRRILDAREAQRRSRAAQECVLALPAWGAAERVALYWPVRGETDTHILRAEALRQGKTVLLPRVLSQQEVIMRFFPFTDAQALAPGVFGIMEPRPAHDRDPRREDEWLPHLAVVPGMAFDAHGFRLGSGAGYYDRFFARSDAVVANIYRVGFAYAFQIVKKCPHASWDIPMHVLVSENGAQHMRNA